MSYKTAKFRVVMLATVDLQEQRLDCGQIEAPWHSWDNNVDI
jgi:hypothetical protein